MSTAAIVSKDGRSVHIETDLFALSISAQEAYELHQALGSVLSQCVQPFATRRDASTRKGAEDVRTS